MNKIVKLALILLVVIVVIIAGGSVYLFKNGQAILNASKPFFESKISLILKTPTELGELKLQVFPNAVVNVASLTIGKTASAPGITVKEINLDVAIFELLKKKLLIKELSVSNPSLKIIKTKTGMIIDGLPLPEKKEVNSVTVTDKAPAETTTITPTEIPGGIQVVLEKFQIDNATIELEDQVTNKKFLISPLTVGAGVELVGSLAKLQNLVVNAEVAGISKLALATDSINFDLKEQNLTLDSLTAKVLDADFKVTSDLNLKSFQGKTGLTGSNIKLATVADALTPFTPALKTLGISGNVTPNINIDILNKKEINASGTVGLSDIAAKFGTINLSQLAGDLNLAADLKKQNISSENIKLLVGSAPVNVNFKANLEGSNAKLENALVNIFGGTANVTAGTDLKSQAFNSSLKVNALDLGQAYQALPMPILKIFTGTLNSLNVTANGSLGPKLMSSIGGEGDLLLTNGTIKGINLPAKVLAVVKDIPFISGSLLEAVPESLRGEITGDDTSIKELKTNFGIAGSSLKINSLSLLSSIFNLTATGTVGLDKSINLNSEITFNQAFSQALASTTKELKHVLDKNGQLVLPLIIKGTSQNLIIVPNLKRLIELGATKAIEEKVKEKVKDKLGESGKELLNKFGF